MGGVLGSVVLGLYSVEADRHRRAAESKAEELEKALARVEDRGSRQGFRHHAASFPFPSATATSGATAASPSDQ